MHRIAVLALPGVIAYELAMPVEVFGRASVGGKAAYRVEVCGETATVAAGPFDLAIRHGLDRIAAAETVFVPGIADITAPASPAVLAVLRGAAVNGARIASICSGAFVLAEAGLLDGLRATTHWRLARLLRERYPTIRVDPAVLFVDEERILTSAGGSAGLDLCLQMLRLDHGAAVAADVARLAVAPLMRAGGQAQFITHETPGSRSSLAGLLTWMEQNLRAELGLAALARQAGMSERTLSRRFREQTGATPLQWTNLARVRHAQRLLETSTWPIERIATEAGFETAATFRKRFGTVVGVAPNAYRRAFA